MKYGEQFEKESVPEWSLHNIDYNSLKHHIKVHTTKDQATAIAIPGHQDTALNKFEDELYTELCRQHDRVDLFVSCKADEIARRLHHVSTQIHSLILRSSTSTRERMPIKRQRRFVRYEQQLLACGQDIQSLRRFVNAQIVAFRKILKKYRKWTGSSTLGSRFRDTVLSHPKSFTKRDFTALQSQYDGVLETLRAATPSGLTSGSSSPPSERAVPPPAERQVSPNGTLVGHDSQMSAGYWNEYDHGSEAGDGDQDGYHIYINPDEEPSFPGMKDIKAFFTSPLRKVNIWVTGRHQHQDGTNEDHERGPLLPSHGTQYGTTCDRSYFSLPPGGPWSGSTDTDVEDDDDNRPGTGQNGSRRGSYGYASSTDERQQFPTGYKTHYPSELLLPSIEEQRVMATYRDHVLLWGTLVGYMVSFALMAIATVLVVTGRHRMRLEVDAGVTLGIMASLGAACASLCMACSRNAVSWATKISVGVAFVVACVGNGVLLVWVVGNAPLR